MCVAMYVAKHSDFNIVDHIYFSGLSNRLTFDVSKKMPSLI